MDRTGITALLRFNKPRSETLRSDLDARCSGYLDESSDLIIAIADRHISQSRDTSRDAPSRSSCSSTFIHIAVVYDVTPRCSVKFRAHLGETGSRPIRETRLIGIPSRAVRPRSRARNVVVATRPQSPAWFLPSRFFSPRREELGVVQDYTLDPSAPVRRITFQAEVTR